MSVARKLRRATRPMADKIGLPDVTVELSRTREVLERNLSELQSIRSELFRQRQVTLQVISKATGLPEEEVETIEAALRASFDVGPSHGEDR